MMEQHGPLRFEDPDEAFTVRLIQATCLILLLGAAALLVNSLGVASNLAIACSALAFSFAATSLYCAYRRFFKTAGLLVTIGFLIALTVDVATAYGLHDIAMVGYPAIIVLAGLLLGTRTLFVFGVAVIGALTIVYFLEVNGYVPRAFVHATDLGDLINIAVILLVVMALLRLLVGNLERSLATLRHQAREQERLISELEAKNRELESFAYTISHDLKTPLVTIGNFAGSLVCHADSDDRELLRNDARRVSSASLKMSALLDGVLELARTGSVIQPPSATSFAEIVREALGRVATTVKARDVKVTVAEDLPEIFADHESMVEVLCSLLDNAVKFMGEQPRPEIEIGLGPSERGPVFFVRDNGIGIQPDFHGRVLEPFHKLDPATTGAGVGLTVAKRVLEAHRGEMWIESLGAETGTEIRFWLPPAPD